MPQKGTVLVTGGARRLGRAIAETLRARGWRVLVSSSRAGAGDFLADFREPEAVQRLFREAVRTAPDLTAIVNNAGLFAGDDAALAAVNAAAPAVLTDCLAAYLKGRDSSAGCVVNILDARILAQAPVTVYERTKSSLRLTTERSAVCHAPHLRVNAVAPGCVLPPEDFHERAAKTLTGKNPSAQDVAAAVAFLLETPSVTGVSIPVDGGSHLAKEGGK